MARIPTLLCLSVLLFCSITAHAARMNPLLTEAIAMTAQLEAVDRVGHGDVELDEEGCKGISKEDCLIRRTLAAHVDYIYTQSQKHKP